MRKRRWDWLLTGSGYILSFVGFGVAVGVADLTDNAEHAYWVLWITLLVCTNLMLYGFLKLDLAFFMRESQPRKTKLKGPAVVVVTAGKDVEILESTT